MIATAIELWNDRLGDFNKSADVYLRLFLFVLEAFLLKWIFGGSIFLAFNVAVAFFFLVFDYAVNYILYRNKVIKSAQWFSYMGSSSKTDNIKWWRNMNPFLRLLVRVGYFILAVYLYATV